MKGVYRILLAITVIILTTLACVLPGCEIDPSMCDLATATLKSTQNISSTNTSPPPLLTITGNVYLRDKPDGVAISVLFEGDKKQGICDGNWCQIDGGYVWRGCVDDNPAGLGCREAK